MKNIKETVIAVGIALVVIIGVLSYETITKKVSENNFYKEVAKVYEAAIKDNGTHYDSDSNTLNVDTKLKYYIDLENGKVVYLYAYNDKYLIDSGTENNDIKIKDLKKSDLLRTKDEYEDFNASAEFNMKLLTDRRIKNMTKYIVDLDKEPSTETETKVEDKKEETKTEEPKKEETKTSTKKNTTKKTTKKTTTKKSTKTSTTKTETTKTEPSKTETKEEDKKQDTPTVKPTEANKITYEVSGCQYKKGESTKQEEGSVGFEQDGKHIVNISMGMRNNGGYSVEIDKVIVDGENATIVYHFETPKPGYGYTQAITYPCTSVVFNRKPKNIKIQDPMDYYFDNIKDDLKVVKTKSYKCAAKQQNFMIDLNHTDEPIQNTSVVSVKIGETTELKPEDYNYKVYISLGSKYSGYDLNIIKTYIDKDNIEIVTEETKKVSGSTKYINKSILYEQVSSEKTFDSSRMLKGSYTCAVVYLNKKPNSVVVKNFRKKIEDNPDWDYASFYTGK